MQYYYNIIKHHSSSDLQLFETTDFTLVNSVDLGNSVPIKFVWNNTDNEELVGLLSSKEGKEVIHISPIIGIVDRIPIEDDITDICVSNGEVIGCFHGGVLNITTSKKFKPNKKFEMITSDINSDKLYLSDKSKVYCFNNSRLSEVKVDIKSGIRAIKKYKDLVVITEKGTAVNDEFFPETINFKQIEDKNFEFYSDKVKVDDVEVVFKNVIDVVKVEDEFKFIYKSGDVLKFKELELVSQVVGDVFDIDLSSLIPEINNLSTEELYNEIISKEDITSTLQSNNDENTIKTVLNKLSEEQKIKIVNTLANQISKSPLNSMTLSLWLKLIIRANPQIVESIPQKKVSTLSKHLSSSLDLLPDLLSIKGKLNLIRMQNQFKQMNIVNEANDEEDEEEGLVIANGEDDTEFVNESD